MAIVKFPGGLIVPPIMPFSAGVPDFSSRTIDAANEKVAFVFTVPHSGTLDKFEFKCAAVSFGIFSTLKISFQNVSNDLPDGTADQYRILGKLDILAWTIPGILTDDGTDLGNKRSVLRGERLACVIEYDTFNMTDSVSINSLDCDNTGWSSPSYVEFYDGSTWTPQIGPVPILALQYDDGAYYQIIGAYPVQSLYGQAYNLDSAIDEWGMLFTMPAPMLIGGVIIRLAGNSAIASVPVVLYDVDGSTILRSTNLTGLIDSNARNFGVRFSSDVRLEANVPYRLTVKPDFSSPDIEIYGFSVDHLELMDMIEGGQTWQQCTRTDNGDWTDVNSQRIWMSLWVTGIDHDISGGSGGTGFEGIP